MPPAAKGTSFLWNPFPLRAQGGRMALEREPDGVLALSGGRRRPIIAKSEAPDRCRLSSPRRRARLKRRRNMAAQRAAPSAMRVVSDETDHA